MEIVINFLIIIKHLELGNINLSLLLEYTVRLAVKIFHQF